MASKDIPLAGSVTNLTIQELLHKYDLSFHEFDTDGMAAVTEECKKREIDFWKIYYDHIMSLTFTEEGA